MTRQPHIISDERYEGASKATVAFGKAKIYGLLGGVTGFLGFGALAGMSPTFMNFTSDAAHKFKGWVERTKFKVMGEAAAKNTNFGVIFGVAAAGWLIGHWAGTAVGLRKGLDKAHLGKEQFEKIKQERNDAESELHELKTEIGTLNKIAGSKSFTEDLQPRDGHAAAVEAEKEHTTEIVR